MIRYRVPDHKHDFSFLFFLIVVRDWVRSSWLFCLKAHDELSLCFRLRSDLKSLDRNRRTSNRRASQRG